MLPSPQTLDASALQQLLGPQRAEQGRVAMRNPVPDWLTESPSVLDSPLKRTARTVGQWIGADDPNAQVMGLLNPTEVGSGLLAKLLGSAKPTVKNLAREPNQFNKLMMDLLTDPHAPKAGRQLEQSVAETARRTKK